MHRPLMIGATIVAGLGAGIAAAVTIAGVHWNREAAGRVARLRVPRDAGARPYSRDDLAGLPAPVARYRHTRLRQVGDFRRVDGMMIPTSGEIEWAFIA